MTPDAQVAQVLQWLREFDAPDFADLTPPQARARYDKPWPGVKLAAEPVRRIEDRTIAGPAQGIPLRIYTPDAAASPLPLLVWLHGGGFVVGGLQSYDAICRALANVSGAIVVSVDYRLAPEHPFPAAVEDAFAALAWTAANAAALGGDAARLAVAGDSAGGNLATVCAILARDAGGPRLTGQALLYPTTVAGMDTASIRACAEGYLLTRRTMDWFHAHYTGGRDLAADPRRSPLNAPDLRGLPPALVIVAGFDPLHDEGVAYAERLKDAGNPVDLIDFEGMVHGFVNFAGYVDAGRVAIEEMAKSLRRGFGRAN